MLSQLPVEVIIDNIVPFLRTEDYCKLRVTCKSFYNLLSFKGEDILLPHQKAHFYRLVKCLQERYIAIDTSLMGTGKTYVASTISLYFNKPILVICPKSVINVWDKVTKDLNIKAEVWTYAKLRGNNPYVKDERITKEYKDKIKKGLLVIFDECHALKNKSKQTSSAISLIKYSMKHHSPSLLISASPIDKPPQCIQYMRMLNILTRDKLARNDIVLGYVREGIQEIFDFCNLSEEEQKTYESLIRGKKKHETIKDLFIQRIKPKFFFSMPPPIMKAEIEIRNEFHRVIDEDNDLLLKSGINSINYSLTMMEIPGEAMHALNMFQKGVVNTETAKLEIIVRAVKRRLKENDKNKVVVCVSFINSIIQVERELAEYNPLVLVGKTTLSQRKERVNIFQTNPRRRLLICNTQVASLGISLDDTVGDSPRFMYIIPNYRIIDMYQAALRIYRTNTKSKATVIYIYNAKYKETHITKTLRNKAKMMGEIADSKFCNSILNPDVINNFIIKNRG